MKYNVLEYSDTQCCFHLNYLENDGKTWHHELFTNNYRPIMIVDVEEWIADKKSGIMMDHICREEWPFEKAAEAILRYWVSKK